MRITSCLFGSALWLGLCLAKTTGVGIASAQENSPDSSLTSLTSGVVQAGHWSYEAVRKAHELGLLRDYLPAQSLLSSESLGAVLLEAQSAAGAAGPGIDRLARAWATRYFEEFAAPGETLLPSGEKTFGLRHASLGAAFLSRTGGAAPGLGWFDYDRTGARSLSDDAGATVEGRVALSVGRYLAVEAAPRLGPEDFDWRVLELVGGWKGWTASVGRQQVGYGWSRGGGVVLSPARAMDRMQIETSRPGRLPGWLRHLGPTAFNMYLSRMAEPRHPGRPFFGGARFAFQPHPRVSFSIQRAALFGGDGTDKKITLENILVMLIGDVKNLSFENQIVSVAARYRLPTDRAIPLTAYLEWGAEDAAGGWFDVPGRVVGVYAPSIPGLPEMGTGVEYAQFPQSCCGNPPWYRHGAFLGGWADDEAPLGHPLGGHGEEYLAYTNAEWLDARLRVEGRAFYRRRYSENLYVPGREGKSGGGSATASLRLREGLDLEFDLFRDQGDGWTDSRVKAGARVFFDG